MTSLRDLPAWLAAPSTAEIEQAVLGAILLDPQRAQPEIATLSEEAFANPRHWTIFRAIRQIAADGLPVGLVEVTDRLRATGELEHAGDALYVTQLLDAVFSSGQLSYHVGLLRRHAAVRALGVLGELLAFQAAQPEPPIQELCTLATHMLEAIRTDLPDEALAVRRVWIRQHKRRGKRS
jgi:replicative DNA helicase